MIDQIVQLSLKSVAEEKTLPVSFRDQAACRPKFTRGGEDE
jgi:antitoxin component of RelBE/YafQ-DinJ toxin-antitoxin module